MTIFDQIVSQKQMIREIQAHPYYWAGMSEYEQGLVRTASRTGRPLKPKHFEALRRIRESLRSA